MSKDDDEVGYGKPPKKHQFKKGQSGCPDGGAAIKRAKKAKAARKEQTTSPQQMVTDWFTKQKKRVKINGKARRLTRLELALMHLEEDMFVKRDPNARKLFFAVAERNGWLKAPPPRSGKTGVLVVYPIMGQEEWEKATEGELLPKDPLHGIPGAEGLLDNPSPPRRPAPPDEDD